MTIVIARKFGQRIVIMSDTMVSDNTEAFFSAIPGQLKAIILSKELSVAYAGNVEKSLDVLRFFQGLPESRRTYSALLEILEKASHAQDCDFIVASHSEHAVLRKIANGATTEELDAAWIGSSQALHLVQPLNQDSNCKLPEFISEEEMNFTRGFTQPFIDGGPQLAKGIGGLPVHLLASPYGHCYANTAFAISWDVIDLSIGITNAQALDQKSGMTSWSANGCASGWRGTAIYGCYLSQISTGYIYNPLEQDAPQTIRNVSLSDFSSLLDELASEKPGTIHESEIPT